jgi:hypothetical protein
VKVIKLTNKHLLILADGVEALLAGAGPHGPLTPEMRVLALGLHHDLARLLGQHTSYTLKRSKSEQSS